MSYGPDGMNEISDLVAGANFSAMVRNLDRAVWVTGDNQSGQLATPDNLPTQAVPRHSNF
jgi:alpha-tubulin suppressor-like RCC1 family protein